MPRTVRRERHKVHDVFSVWHHYSNLVQPKCKSFLTPSIITRERNPGPHFVRIQSPNPHRCRRAHDTGSGQKGANHRKAPLNADENDRLKRGVDSAGWLQAGPPMSSVTMAMDED
jgi:hypothetical protein